MSEPQTGPKRLIPLGARHPLSPCPARTLHVIKSNMNPAITADRFAAGVAVLSGLIARHGHLRRLAGPLLILIWQRVRGIGVQVGALLARIEAGTLRRYPARRAPLPSAEPRRRPAPGLLPNGYAWLAVLIPETAVSGAHLQNLLADPDIPALLEFAPQLRRALRPLCRMLGVKLPPSPPRPRSALPPSPPLVPDIPWRAPSATNIAPLHRASSNASAKPSPGTGPPPLS